MPLIKRSSILSVKMLPIHTVLDGLTAIVSACHERDERETVLPGFISFLSNVPGPCDEVLAEI